MTLTTTSGMCEVRHAVNGRWREWAVQVGLSPSTIRMRMWLVSKLDEPTREGVERFCFREGVSPRTRRTYLEGLRCLFADLIHLNMWEGPTPTDGVRPPKVQPTQPRPLTDDQVDAMLAVGGHVGAATLLGVHAGLRASEVLLVRREHLVHTVHGLGLHIPRGKGGKAATVPAHPKVARLVAEMPDDPWPYDVPNRLSSDWRRAATKLGLPRHLSFHCCRHTFGTRAYRATLDLLLTRDLLRHASVTSTQVYAAAADNRAWQVVATL